ncbi:hypothetical protein AAFG22_14800 [Bradyrhizobium sp. B024]|uniref:hypothetical protein n=1 Tax=Bradyrhizobium sp. B024 TaxID=3140247 RepID=UPI00318348B2
MAKAPKDAPTVGDRVELRGKALFGTLKRVDPDFWCGVKWEINGPLICHLFELKTVQSA